MGYREDVSLAIGAPIWDDIIAKIQSELLSDEERKGVIDLLNDADTHAVNDDGDHCLVWESIKTYTDDSTAFFNRVLGSADADYWYMVNLGEDGTTEYAGNWDLNPFEMCVTHNMSTNTDDCELWSGIGVLASHNPTPAKVVTNGPPVNDHTCTACGNQSCSSQEKSCWKCGHPI